MPDNRFFEKLISFVDKLSKYKTTVMTMAVVVVFVVTYLLILPAFTLEKTEAEKQGGIDIGTQASAEISEESADIDADGSDAEAADANDAENSGEADTVTDAKVTSDAKKNTNPDSDESGKATVKSESEPPETATATDHEEAETIVSGDDLAVPLTFEGDGFSVAVEDTAGILPSDTSVEAAELVEEPTEGTKAERKAAAEEYRNYYDKALEAINDEANVETEKKISFVKFYDITLQSGENAIQPEKPVNVTISYDKQQQKDLKVEVKKDVRIIHFAEDEKTGEITAEILDDKDVDVTLEKSRITDTTFEAEGFSVYGIVYTVDFRWDTGGKSFEFSIPGGSYTSFTKLVETLGITDQDVYAFVANVENIEFSDPDLLWVGKAEEDTTVGNIKNSRGLECEYSSDLTEKQISEINAQTVEAGEWSLISLKPFDTEETLTVTMKNGEQFDVKVTDAQISTNALTADGKTYKITVTFDDDAEIPAGTRLIAEEIGQDTDEYMQYLGQTWTEVNNEYLELLVSKGSEEYCDIPQMSIDQARFFKITLMLGDQEIEPKVPVQVEISYVDGLGIDGIKERTAGVSHFKDDNNEPVRNIKPEKLEKPEEPEAEEGRIEVYFNDGSVELIEGVQTSTDEEGRITGYRYEQDSFTVVGTYIGHETRDAVMRIPQVRLSGTRGDSLETPDPQKHLEPNKNDGVEDGTYTLSLSVTGDSKNSTKVETKKSNVLFIMDRSSSMNRYVRYLGTIDPASTSYFGSTDNGRTVFPVLYDSQTGKWQYQRRVGFSYQWVDYDADQYGFYINDARLPQEQDALKSLFQQLLAKNEINDENIDDDNVEIRVISFATKAGNNQGWSGTESDWVDGTSSTALENAVNKDSTAGGTNWEEALKYAQSVMNDKKESDGDDEDYYVIFLTDGGPTATTWSASSTGANYNGAYYGTEGHSANDLDGHNPPRPRNSCEPAYEDASDDARALVDAGYKLYNIFTYGTNDDYKYMVRLTNYAYRESEYIYDNVHDHEEPRDYFPDSEAAQKYFTNATDTEKLVEAFNNIFSQISVTQAHVQVKITDGLSQDAMTSTFVNGDPSGVRYTVTQEGSTTPLYTVTASGSASDPIVTFTINGHDYSTESGDVVRKEKQPDETDPLASYDAGVYYSYTDNETGVEYKMALASVDNNGLLTWDLQPIGMLWDDCTYKAEFIVWPNQDAYDYVAALNNGINTITNSDDEDVKVEWNHNNATEVTDSEQNVYYQGGCAAYPSIVYYPGEGDDYEKGIYNGTFAVLTNTDQYLDYSIVTTENGEVTSVVPQERIPMDKQDPMKLTATGSRISKVWNVNRDPDALLRLLYEFDGDVPRVDEYGQPIPKQYEYIVIDEETGEPVIDDETGEPETATSGGFFIDFKVLQDTNDPNATAYKTVRLGWNEEEQQYVWLDGTKSKTYQVGENTVTLTYGTKWEQDFSIATGLMLTYDQLEAIGLDPSDYPHGQYPDDSGETYYLLEDGHDYTLVEPELGFEFDFSAPTYHPMLIDGVMKNVLYTKIDDDTISISKIEELELNQDGASILDIINTLRGYIHVNKNVVDVNGNAISDDETKFTYTVTLHNDDGAFIEDGSHIPWYGINELFYHSIDENEEYHYYQAEPAGSETIDGNVIGYLTLKDEDGVTHTATCDGEFDEKIVGPTEVTFTDSGETIMLFGNQMDCYPEDAIPGIEGAYSEVSATFMITQDQQLNIANVPVSTRYTITELDEDGYRLIRIDSSVSDSIASGSEISGTIVPDSDTNITYINRCLVTDISIQKVDNNGTGLEGAVFQLKKIGLDGHSESDATDVDSVSGLTTITKIVNGETKTYTSALESSGSAQVIKGLPDGTYRLYEVVVPAGYISTYGYIQFEIENRDIKNVTTDTGDTSELDTSANNIDLIIANEPGAALPNAGGIGTTIFYVLGSLLVLGCGIYLIARRRMNEPTRE